MKELIVYSDGEESSLELGAKIGRMLVPGDVVALWGELGAGKTALTRGIARGLGISPSIPITSPTFTFVNEYDGRLHLYHLDLYRLTDPDELETLPWREALFGTGAAVVEWPERMGYLLPDERWDVHITITGDESRRFSIRPQGEGPTSRWEQWEEDLAHRQL